jgi:hypothetical protein
MAELGAENFPESQQSPAEHRKLLASETSRWGKLIAAAGEFAD